MGRYKWSPATKDVACLHRGDCRAQLHDQRPQIRELIIPAARVGDPESFTFHAVLQLRGCVACFT